MTACRDCRKKMPHDGVFGRCYSCRAAHAPQRYCAFCAGEIERPSTSRFCLAHVRLRSQQTRYLSGRTYCASQVSRAVRVGMLPSASLLTCADCGGAAGEYDHRDYNFPLLVEPTCRGCNARRGSAIWKRWESVESFQDAHEFLGREEAFRIYYARMTGGALKADQLPKRKAA